MLEALKYEVLKANLLLPKYKLVTFTWGNVSSIDREKGLIVIKPSGVPYDQLKLEHLAILDLDGNQVEGHLNPSSDTPTHLALYCSFPKIQGIVHTHSEWATIWAQSGRDIPCLGTTHADYFYGEIPCTRKMRDEEIQGEYETQIGKVIAETFNQKNPMDIPGVLVNNHGPFCWGTSVEEAIHNAVVMEHVAKMAYQNVLLESSIKNIDQTLLNKHFLRKHGRNAYYGQIDVDINKEIG